MPYPKTNQTKPGFPRSTDGNPTVRTGRPDGTDALAGHGRNQTSTNYPRDVQSNPTKRTGRPLPGEITGRGYSADQPVRTGPVRNVSEGVITRSKEK